MRKSFGQPQKSFDVPGLEGQDMVGVKKGYQVRVSSGENRTAAGLLLDLVQELQKLAEVFVLLFLKMKKLFFLSF